MVGRTPAQDRPCCPINMWIMTKEPKVAQNEGVPWCLQDMKLNSVMVIISQQHMDRNQAMSDSTQEPTIQSISKYWVRKRPTLDANL